MKFTVSTKPLSNALDLGVVNANISKFYKRSCVAQLTATKDTLRINLQASFICSELILKGSGSDDSTATALVDCAMLKSLVGTFEANLTTIEFIEGGVVLHSGSSKFNLASLEVGEDVELDRPEGVESATAPTVKVDNSGWKFIKDYQLYAAATTFVHPVYTRVWVGASGDVIVGDFDNSLFTFSKKGALGETCLISDTIVNLFTSLPEGAEITKLEKGYRVDVKTDGFEFAASFTPQHESDEGVGSYRSDIILETNVKDPNNLIKVNAPTISKFLSQADLLSSGSQSRLIVALKGDELQIKDENVDCKVKVEGACQDFQANFSFTYFRTLFSNLNEDVVEISPIISQTESGQDVVEAITVSTPDLSVVLGSEE